MQYAERLKAEYWEISAKQNSNVKELFNRISFVTWWAAIEKWYQSYKISHVNEQQQSKISIAPVVKQNSQQGISSGAPSNNSGNQQTQQPHGNSGCSC